MFRRTPRILLAALAFLVASLGVADVAEADVDDELFMATLLVEQAYKGQILLDGTELRAGPNGSVGGSLRLELLPGRWVGVGVEGHVGYFRMGRQLLPLTEVGTQTFGVQIEDGRHFVGGTNLFLRLRFALSNGTAEYYFIGGGGVGFMRHESGSPNQYGVGLAGGSETGWTAYARFGLRGQLLPGFGALVEVGWSHREHLGAFEHTLAVGGSEALRTFDYVINRISLTIGWYFAR